MNIARLGLFLLAGALGVGVYALCVGGFAQEVGMDYDHKVSFERFHTYSWGKMDITNTLWESRIRAAVERELQQKGWQRSDSNPGVIITAVGSSQNQQEYQTFYDGMSGWGWRSWDPDITTATVTTYKVGTLLIDIYDASNKQLVFRGIASDTLVKNLEHNVKELDKALDKMFKKFPPESNRH
jgi:uncharacterized protein DUF4136